jgi:predicted Zn-dependent peptidase
MQNLREKHGYTYGANSGFSYRRSAGPFTASAEVVTAKTDSALIEFMKELKSIRDTVPSNELERAKRFLQLGLPQGFETTRGIAGQLLPLVTYDVPLDFYNTAVQRIGAVTQADVQRVAQQYIDPSKLTLVIVGDRKVIEPGLRAVNPGTIVVREARDVLGAPPTP